MKGNPFVQYLQTRPTSDAEAVMNATLALAFEQRTANLLAFADMEIRSNGELPQSLRHQIGERLGLT